MPSSSPSGDQVLSALTQEFDQVRAAYDTRDHARAREAIVPLAERALSELAEREDVRSLHQLALIGWLAHQLGEFRAAESVQRRVVDVRTRTRPPDDLTLQDARYALSVTLSSLGDLAGARALAEQVLDVRSRVLPADDAAVQRVRWQLGNLLDTLGDSRGAREQFELVLEVYTRTLPEDDPRLQAARGNLAEMLKKLGEPERADALTEQVYAALTRTQREGDGQLETARYNVAAMQLRRGDLAAARALFEQAYAIAQREHPDDHRDVQRARLGLAAVLMSQGDLAAARLLQEKALAIYSRALPDTHPDVQRARDHLAGTLWRMGELRDARDLFVKVLEIRARTLPPEHVELAHARLNLSGVCYWLGEYAAARELAAEAFEVCERTLADDDSVLQLARRNLGETLRALGEFEAARAQHERVLEVFERALPEDHAHVQDARQNLAATIALESAGRPASFDAPAGDGAARERFRELMAAVCRAQLGAVREVLLTSPPREAEARSARLAARLDGVLSFARGAGVFEPLVELERPAFELSEVARGAALVTAELARRAAASPRYAALRLEARKASEDLAALARRGAPSAEVDLARVRGETAQRELIALARELDGAQPAGIEFDLPSLAAVLGERSAAVAFRRFRAARIESEPPASANATPTHREVIGERMLAFVVRRGESEPTAPAAARLELVDLGAFEPIERAVASWRSALGAVGGRGVPAAAASAPQSLAPLGDALRRLVIDPLLPSLGEASHWILVLDDVLHLVPFDALPLDESGSRRLGDATRIEVHSTLTELLARREPFAGAASLLCVGDVRYDGEESQLLASATTAQPPLLVRGGAWSGGFTPLPATRAEIEGLQQSFAHAFGEPGERELLSGAGATRARLVDRAAAARYLHVATHGWFAPESMRSWSDPSPLDAKSGLGSAMSGAEQVEGMSPMLLCGLALAGANLPEDAFGRAPGLITAEEIAALDLSSCELAVLSACDTNVGVRRAGQGVASLQKALHMAGARSVITSLWKVPDEATKELMVDFYRRIWVEKKPKSHALWEAKSKLRAAKDENGKPTYTTRDWAAWVLTGNPI